MTDPLRPVADTVVLFAAKCKHLPQVWLPLYWLCSFTCFSCFCCRLGLAFQSVATVGTLALLPSGRQGAASFSSSCCFISCGSFHIRGRKTEVTDTHWRTFAPKMRHRRTLLRPADGVESRTLLLLKSVEKILRLVAGSSPPSLLAFTHCRPGRLIEN